MNHGSGETWHPLTMNDTRRKKTKHTCLWESQTQTSSLCPPDKNKPFVIVCSFVLLLLIPLTLSFVKPAVPTDSWIRSLYNCSSCSLASPNVWTVHTAATPGFHVITNMICSATEIQERLHLQINREPTLEEALRRLDNISVNLWLNIPVERLGWWFCDHRLFCLAKALEVTSVDQAVSSKMCTATHIVHEAGKLIAWAQRGCLVDTQL